VNCHEIAPLRAAFVDGDIPDADRSRVEAHVAGCPVCAREVRIERQVRALIHARRAALTSEVAPAALSARAASLASDARRARMPSWGWPVAAAAAMLVAVAGLRLATGWSTVVLAAQLTADHAKCHWLDGARETRDSLAVRDYLASQYGVDAPVPPSSADGRLQLLGGRGCLTGEGRDVHMLYRYEGQRVSLFLVPHDERRPQALDVLGAHTVMWPRPSGTYVLVADGSIPKASMPRLEAYMRRATEGRPREGRSNER
jgi:anti-sigma factor RsiW